jgi:hypothetical protein
MQHSVDYIGKKREEFSIMRKDEKQFNSKDFFEFAKKNKEKYSIIESGTDLLVSTWYSNELIEAYRLTIK